MSVVEEFFVKIESAVERLAGLLEEISGQLQAARDRLAQIEPPASSEPATAEPAPVPAQADPGATAPVEPADLPPAERPPDAPVDTGTGAATGAEAAQDPTGAAAADGPAS